MVEMRKRALSLLMRPMFCPLALGIVVAVASIVVEMLLLYPLGQVPPGISLGVACLVVSTCGSGSWRRCRGSLPAARARGDGSAGER